MCYKLNQSLKLQFVVGVVLLSVFYCDGVSGQESPCPNVFEYKNDELNNYGVVRLPAAKRTNNLQVKLGLDKIPDGSTAARITIFGDKSEFVEKLRTGGYVKYKLSFPSGIQANPRILSVMLNNQEYCDNSQGNTFRTILTVKYDVALNTEDDTIPVFPTPPKPINDPIPPYQTKPNVQPPQKTSSVDSIHFETQNNEYTTVRSRPINQPASQKPKQPSEDAINFEPQYNDYDNIRFPPQPPPPPTGLLNRVQTGFTEFKRGLRVSAGFWLGRR